MSQMSFENRYIISRGNLMKKAIFTILCLLSLPTYANKINVKVSGMVCSMCVQRIKKKFSKMDSIREINVNLDNKIVQIQTKDGQIITDDQINEVIKEAGYNVANIERE